MPSRRRAAGRGQGRPAGQQVQPRGHETAGEGQLDEAGAAGRLAAAGHRPAADGQEQQPAGGRVGQPGQEGSQAMSFALPLLGLPGAARLGHQSLQFLQED